jgi:hypothetical protein
MAPSEMENFNSWLAKNKRKNSKLINLVLAFITVEKRNDSELVEWHLNKAQS